MISRRGMVFLALFLAIAGVGLQFAPLPPRSWEKAYLVMRHGSTWFGVMMGMAGFGLAIASKVGDDEGGIVLTFFAFIAAAANLLALCMLLPKMR